VERKDLYVVTTSHAMSGQVIRSGLSIPDVSQDEHDRERELELERAFRPTAQSWQPHAGSRFDRTPSSTSRQPGNLKEE
jgi:hypothetical protein